MTRTRCALLCIALVTGCSREEAAPASPPPAPPTPTELPAGPPIDPAVLLPIMRDHASHAEEARLAIQRGDLEGARAPLLWLAAHPEPERVPTRWRASLVTVEIAAHAAAGAPDLEHAARALGTLAERCATCHVDLDRGPGVPVDAPPGGEDLADHMQRHAWAMLRMWQGLVAPSTAMYRRGALALVEAPVHGEAPPDQEFPTEITGLAARVHELGLAAREATDPAEQARLYGDLLATCAACHHAVEAF